jgi:Bacteriophage tail sheath protein
MPASFLHGVEVFEYNTGPAPILVVKSAVIGIVGSAPLWAVAGALQLWDYSWLILAGQQIIDGNGNTQTCTTGGTTSATTVPTWGTTLNSTVVDGTATWTLTALGPIANLQAPVLVAGSSLVSTATCQAGMFGPLIQGYTIPYALATIFAQGAGQAIVVNVFNQTTHFTTLTAQAFSMPGSGNQVISVGHMGISLIKVTNTGASTTYIQGTDYTVDHVNGLILAKGGGAITTGQALKVTFNYADPSQISDANLVGTVTSNVYTGMQAWKLSYGLMGFFPKILIAPSFSAGAGMQGVGSQDATTASGLLTLANAMRAMCLIDCAPAATPAALIAKRGATGDAWNTSSTRQILCGPEEQFSDTGIVPTGITLTSAGTPVQNLANKTAVMPFSPFVAGALAFKDLAKGYWWSPSNTPMIGALGPDVSLYSSILDAASDVNNLNSNGIVTAFSAFGTGLRVWGNRSAGYPTISTPDQFINVRRTMDVIEESVELNMMQYLDQPISNALISQILANVNGFIRSLIQRGALVAGAASYNPAENPAAQIANGQLVFDIDCMPPPPAERITFNVFIDTSLLSQLTGNAQGQSPAASATA